jgi:hypothetical protein
MDTRKLALLFTALVGLAASAFAQTTHTQAFVARVTGAATVTLPDGTTTPLTAGMKVSQGATITTGADGDVYLESHAGYLTSIKGDSVVTVDEISVTTEGSKVTEERTMLDLKSGNLVAKLDPNKKAINNYQVRTPEGVAAAQGTTFVIQYKGRTMKLAVVNGAVTVNEGGTYYAASHIFGLRAESINNTTLRAGDLLAQAKQIDGKVAKLGSSNFGRASASEANRFASNASLAQAQANDHAELLAAVLASVAVAAQNGLGGATVAEAQAIARDLLTAIPGVAAQAAAMMSNSGVKSGAVVEAIKAVMPASQQAAFDSSLSTGTFQQNTVNATTRSFEQTTTTPKPIDPATVSRSN